jgi:hypothetical protein
MKNNKVMEEKLYDIRITGSGSFKDIRKALLNVVGEMNFILDANGDPLEDINWEDETLMTKIIEKE